MGTQRWSVHRPNRNERPDVGGSFGNSLSPCDARYPELETTQQKRVTMDMEVKVYFCDPQRPWQRGSNENTKGLLRQYSPKRTDLSERSKAELGEVAKKNFWISACGR